MTCVKLIYVSYIDFSYLTCEMGRTSIYTFLRVVFNCTAQIILLRVIKTNVVAQWFDLFVVHRALLEGET